MISSLTKKLNEYEGIVIPKLKDQIRKYKEDVHHSRSRQQSSEHHQYSSQIQESPAFVCREARDSNALLVKTSYGNEKEDLKKNIEPFVENKVLEFSPEKDTHKKINFK